MGGTGSYDPYRRDPTGGANPPDTGEALCADLRFTASVQLPPEPVDVSSGAVFEVCRTEYDGAQIVGVFNTNGELVGSIVDQLDRLLPCLSSGVAFIAEVMTVNYGTPSVRVVAASIAAVTSANALIVDGNSPADTGEGDLRLLPADSPLPMAVAVELDGTTISLDHPRFCELRALMRVGVSFLGRITAPGNVTLESAE